MSKVLLINGSPHPHGCIDLAFQEIIKTLNQNDIESEKVWLGKKAIADCIACGYCEEHGECVFHDQVNEIGKKIDEYDGIIVGSPVYYGGENGRLTSFLDRLFYSIPKEKFENKLGAAVVSCRRGGATEAFVRLNQFFLMSNMYVVGSQYWNQIHGNNAEEAKKDIEGLQTMRTLAQNMAWLLKSIAAGKEKGLEPPVHEVKKYTNFI